MNAEEEEEATVIALWYLVKLMDDVPNRKMWVHPINEKRNLKPFIAELRADPEKFYNYCRMKPVTFDFILGLITPTIQKRNTNYRQCITPEERLLITLR